MTIKLYSKFHRAIALSDTLADSNDDRVVTHAKLWTAREDGNEFLFQELEGDGFTFRLSCFKINHPTSFIITSHFTICFHISLFQTTQFELAGYGTVTLHQRRYNLIAVPSFSAQFKISDYSLLLPLEICFTPEFLHQFRAHHARLDEFIKRAEKGHAAALFEISPIACTEMLAMIDLIIECGKDSSWDCEWATIYVYELLHYALHPIEKPRKIKMPPNEINRLYEAEDLLLQNHSDSKGKIAKRVSNHASISFPESNIEHLISESEWDIKELAEFADMTVYSFLKKFKDLFGHSLPNYRKEIVWQAVLVLLLRGQENLKSISSLAGYNDQPSFSRAFKKRFGCTPSEFVQKMTKKLENYKKSANKN